MAHEQPERIDLDFLPAKYREEALRRRETPWRLAVILLFALGVGLTAFRQARQRDRLAADLAAAQQRQHQAHVQVEAVHDLETQLELEEHAAALYAYLRHPWPRTQIVAAVVAPLTESITLTELRISKDAVPDRPARAGIQPARLPGETDAEATDDESPHQKDLRRLIDESSDSRVIVVIGGTTHDVPALHAYLGELAASRLLAAPRLESLQAHENPREKTMHFRARLMVVPGLGQPGGPQVAGGPSPARALPTAIDGASRR